ncbi:hypothetical protein CMO91_03260 [Candidatus Woesearchaeota archaeon]|nr:hypothetical protein [Candidatus Woesearchaeota archaeon]
MRRWKGLDVAKAVCCIAMVYAHTLFWLTLNESEGLRQGAVRDMIGSYAIIGLLPLSIPLLAGAAFYFRRQRLDAQGAITAACFLMLVGFLMNLLAFGAEDLLSWDVLQFIATSFMALYVLRHAWRVAVAGIATLALTPWINSALEGSASYTANVLTGQLANQYYWPFFPWFSTVAAGYLLAVWKQHKSFARGAPIAGLALLGFATLNNALAPPLQVDALWYASMFRPSLSFVLAVIGAGCMLLSIGDWVSKRDFPWVPWFSKGILWIYVVHTIVGYRILPILGRESVSILFAHALAFVMLALSASVGWAIVRKAQA